VTATGGEITDLVSSCNSQACAQQLARLDCEKQLEPCRRDAVALATQSEVDQARAMMLLRQRQVSSCAC
jgi:hypothetical protein